MDALFSCALHGSSVARVHAAALAAYLHGKAKEAFDWDRRPFWLEFGEEDPAKVEAAFRRLCAECSVDPVRYLSSPGPPAVSEPPGPARPVSARR